MMSNFFQLQKFILLVRKFSKFNLNLFFINLNYNFLNKQSSEKDKMSNPMLMKRLNQEYKNLIRKPVHHIFAEPNPKNI